MKEHFHKMSKAIKSRRLGTNYIYDSYSAKFSLRKVGYMGCLPEIARETLPREYRVAAGPAVDHGKANKRINRLNRSFIHFCSDRRRNSAIWQNRQSFE